MTARLSDDAHVAATALYDEIAALGYPRSYATFTRQLRTRRLRPTCAVCTTVAERATIDLVHEPGDETQWDWLELPQAPWLPDGRLAQLLVGTSPWSSRCRAVFADATDQPHLIAALDGVVCRFGGVARAWRFDRMGTVVAVGTDRVRPSFAEVAKHYAVDVRICPAYRANRKGAVEKSNHFIAQRWWRTCDVATAGEAQVSLDVFLAGPGDARVRHVDGRRTTVGALGDAEPLRAALVSQRIGDRKVLRLVRAFLRAGVIEEHGGFAASLTGTPQGGIASPLLANVYLSVLDRHFQHAWENQMSPRWRRQHRRRRRQPLPNYRLIRYADDFVVLLDGTRTEADAIKAEVGELLADRIAMTLSVDKTLVTHIDDGFDFLGLHTRRVTSSDGRQVVRT